MEEKILLEDTINGFKMVYTAEINNKNYLGETDLNKKYLHIKCTVSSNRTESTLFYKNVSALDIIKLDTPNDIKGFVNEIVEDMDISYCKNTFVENLTKVIKDYKAKNLNFDKLEEYFDNDIHIHHLLFNTFDDMEFIPSNTDFKFATTLAIYPYYYNKSYNLHVKLTYSCTKLYDTFEYKINTLIPNRASIYECEKITFDILRSIYHKGYVNPVISTSSTIIDMVKYCFGKDLFKDIEEIEKEEK